MILIIGFNQEMKYSIVTIFNGIKNINYMLWTNSEIVNDTVNAREVSPKRPELKRLKCVLVDCPIKLKVLLEDR